MMGINRFTIWVMSLLTKPRDPPSIHPVAPTARTSVGFRVEGLGSQAPNPKP